MSTRLFTFAGGAIGAWRIVSMAAVVGAALPDAPRLNLIDGPVAAMQQGVSWVLRGIASHERYVTRQEKKQLVAQQPNLGRPEAACAALIPIRKTPAWWGLTQDERRTIFEERSDHAKTGIKYLPAVARRLHHCRDLGENEPFDFLTWFEYAPPDSQAFEELVGALRATIDI